MRDSTRANVNRVQGVHDGKFREGKERAYLQDAQLEFGEGCEICHNENIAVKIKAAGVLKPVMSGNNQSVEQ